MDKRLFALYLVTVLLLSGCKPQAPAFLPVTGGKSVSAPIQVEMARKNALQYVVVSSRLSALPQDADWQLDTQQSSANEYCYRNGDWQVVILLKDSRDENQRVVILNQTNKSAWTGYITPAGDIVDTYYSR